jgi:hypothetical protein
MKVEFMKSSLPELYSQALQEMHMVFSSNYAHMVAYTAISAVGDLLRSTKSPDKAAAFVLKDESNNTLVCAVVKFIDSNDPEHPEGNWSYSWSFSDEIIPEGAAVSDLNNAMVQNFFVNRSGHKYGMEYQAGMMVPMYVIFFKCLREWLESNAKPEEECEIEYTDVFSARAGYEDGELVMSIEPLGKFVQLIKDDAELEV